MCQITDLKKYHSSMAGIFPRDFSWPVQTLCISRNPSDRPKRNQWSLLPEAQQNPYRSLQQPDKNSKCCGSSHLSICLE